jgi:hypothetical protein
MLVRILPLILLTGVSATPADAGRYVYWRDGSVTYLPDEVVTLAVVLGLLLCIGLVFACIAGVSSSSVTRMSLDLPEEIREPDTVKHYEEMTERTRALKRKLDADTELAESYIKAARARAALDDLDDTPGEKPARGRSS